MSLGPETENLGAARALVRMFGGVVSMIEQGTHLTDLDQVVHPGDDIDPTSIRQLTELAEIMRIRQDGTLEDENDDDPYGIRWIDLTPPQEEPFITPQIAEDWLINQTSRAVKKEDGSIRFRADQRPDHLGFAAMEIAMGEDPQLFSEVYAEVTNKTSPLADDTLRRYAEGMVARFFEEAQ